MAITGKVVSGNTDYDVGQDAPMTLTEEGLLRVNASFTGAGDATAANQALQITEETAINTVLGVKADAKSTATDTTAVSGISIWKQISASIQAAAASLAGTLTVASHAVTNAGTFAVQAAATLAAETTKVIGTVNITAAQLPESGQKAFGSSVPVVHAFYELAPVVAASQTDTILGATGGVGDYLDKLVCVVTTAATSQVQIKDGNGSAFTVLPNAVGGGVGTYHIMLGIQTVNATTPGWKVTTAAGVAVLGFGNFT